MADRSKAFEGARRELDYVFRQVPFFEAELRDAGVHPARIKSPADMALVPITRKTQYRVNFPEGVVAGQYALGDRRLHQTQSSGSVGDRLRTVELGGVFLERAIQTLKVHPRLLRALVRQPRRHCRYAAPNCSDVECASPRSTVADRTLPDGTLVLAVHHDLLTTPAPMIEQTLEEIGQFSPELYYVDPNHFSFLLEQARERGVKIPPADVLLSYTSCTKACGKRIRRALGDDAVVSPVLALSELGFIAAECPQGALHLNDTSFYTELLSHGEPAQPGSLAELVVTTCQQGCSPRIRYATGDLFRLLDVECRCGHPSPVVRFEGRRSQLMMSRGKVVLTPLELDELIGAPDGLAFYQLQQLEENRFRLAYIADSDWTAADERQLRDRVLSRLGDEATLSCNRTRYIPCAPSGKLMSCVSELGESAWRQAV